MTLTITDDIVKNNDELEQWEHGISENIRFGKMP